MTDKEIEQLHNLTQRHRGLWVKIIRPWIAQGYTITEEEIRPQWFLLRFFYNQEKTDRAGVLIYHVVNSQQLQIEAMTHKEPSEIWVDYFCVKYDQGRIITQ